MGLQNDDDKYLTFDIAFSHLATALGTRGTEMNQIQHSMFPPTTHSLIMGWVFGKTYEKITELENSREVH